MNVGAVAVRHDPASAALVRHAIDRDLTEHAIDRNSIDDVILVASELVGNAVVHGTVPDSPDAPLDIVWDIEDAHVVIRVGDRSSALPEVRLPSQTATGGRGLAIVGAIASEWGVERFGDGKHVWARVPISPA